MSQDPLTPGVSQKTYTKSQPLIAIDHAAKNIDQFQTNNDRVWKHCLFPYVRQQNLGTSSRLPLPTRKRIKTYTP